MSGLPLLTVYLTKFVTFLNTRRKTNLRVELMYTMKDLSGQKGVNPSTDVAIVLSDLNRRPLIIYEYKPQIPTQVKGSSIKDLLELFIQGYYCATEHKLVNCVLCLTDSINWHYFGVKFEQHTIKILWSFSIGRSDKQEGEVPQEDTILQHFQFFSSLALF